MRSIMREAVLLAVVEALVERLGGVGELLQRGRPRRSSRRRRGAAARSRRAGCAALSPRRARGASRRSARSFMRSARCLARSRIAVSTAGQFFSCSAVSFSPALSAGDARVGERGDVLGAEPGHAIRVGAIANCCASARPAPARVRAIVPRRVFSSTWATSRMALLDCLDNGVEGVARQQVKVWSCRRSEFASNCECFLNANLSG